MWLYSVSFVPSPSPPVASLSSQMFHCPQLLREPRSLILHPNKRCLMSLAFIVDLAVCLCILSITDHVYPFRIFHAVVGTENPVCCGSLCQLSSDLIQQTIIVQPLQQILEAPTLATDFEVRIYYRGRQVFTKVFRDVRGLCFLPPGCSGSNPDFADVIFPSPENLNDRLQVSYSHRLIQGVAPGVLLCTEGQSLCGMRRGPCHIYWSQSEIPAAGMLHGELPKEGFGPMYSLQQFVHELIGFMEGRNGSPNYSLWLCFGEQWPDTNRPWKKKLIMVEVIPKVFELLHEMSKAGGASSLGEPDLRISDPCFLDQLRSWEERMDVHCN